MAHPFTLPDCPYCRQIHRNHPTSGGYPGPLVENELLLNRARQIQAMPERGAQLDELAHAYGITRRTLLRYLARER